jgi:hypothetical protein
MLKKSGILFSNHLQSLHPAGAKSTTSPSRTTRRPYAVLNTGGHSRNEHDQCLRWPEVTSANAIPTPYQIFNQRKGSQYSKKRFYELVKLYHPDRHEHGSSSQGLSYATKLERYRLVVAANDLLSDPVKRGAYDCYGAGWNGQPNVLRPGNSSDPSGAWGVYGGRGWRGGPQGPSQNATWEDWERWYQRDAKRPQEPRFVSNSAFVGLIVIFAALGGIGQATRAGNYSMSFMEQRNALHHTVSKDLTRRRKEATTAFGSREERIHSFLKQRDPIGHGITDPREESHRKWLPPHEVCSSGDVKERPIELCPAKINPADG